MSGQDLTTASAPAQGAAGDGTWTGVVIRPPNASWDGLHYAGDALVAASREALAGLRGPVQLVIQGSFVAVAAPDAATARIAAARLAPRWQAVADSVIPATGSAAANGLEPATVSDAAAGAASATAAATDAANASDAANATDAANAANAANAASAAASPVSSGPPAASARSYFWPGDRAVATVPPQAWAHWHGDGLEIRADAVEPRRLRRELARLLALELGQILVHAEDRPVRSGQVVFAGEGYDAAADAALIARAVGHPVRVIASPMHAAPVSIALQAGAAAPASWSLTPGLALGPRPTWAALTAMVASAAHQADGDGAGVAVVPHARHQDGQASGTVAAGLPGNLVMPYAPGLQSSAARNATTPGIGVDGRSAEVGTVFAMESFADELAHDAGEDPVQWRLNHLDDPAARALVESVSQSAGWTSPDPARRTGRGRGFALASTLDTTSEPPRRAWAAWVVDLKVDALAGRVDVAGMTVGHHVEGLQPASAADGALQSRIVAAATQLLHGPQAYDDWTGPQAALPAARVVDIVADGAGGQPADLSASPALTLPLAAAMANAVYDATGIRLREPPFNGAALQRAALDAADNGKALTGQAARPSAQGAQSGPRRPWRRALAWTGAAAATVAGIAAAALPWRAAIAPAAPDLTLYSAAAIERGRLIAAASDCVVCHTAPGGKDNAGGLAMETPFGTIYSTNITPDPEHGIGNWTFQAFERAMRHGISRDGRHLYPAFPYTSFAKFSDGDMQALYAYLMTQEPVASAPPRTELPFPYGLRPLMAGWNLLFHDAAPFAPDPDRSTLWNRGAYLVQGAGHCGACHTARNAFGAEKRGPGDYLGGATVDHWDAPALNALSTAPLPWTRDDLYDYLRTGHSVRHGVAAGPMAPVIAGLAALPDRDILAMATYLADLRGDDAANAARATAGTPAAVSQAPASLAAVASGSAAATPAPSAAASPAVDSPGAASPVNMVSPVSGGAAAVMPATPNAPAPAPASAPASAPAAAPAPAPAPAPTAAAALMPEPARLFSMPGHRIFEGACAACHDQGRGMPLFGVRPDLAVNTNLTAARPDNLIHVILNGITEPADENLGYMPGFAATLNDKQVADLVDYLRARHGSGAPAWQGVEQTVARIRQQSTEVAR